MPPREMNGTLAVCHHCGKPKPTELCRCYEDTKHTLTNLDFELLADAAERRKFGRFKPIKAVT